MMFPFFSMILRRPGAYTEKLTPSAPHLHDIPPGFHDFEEAWAYTEKLTPSAPLTLKKGTWKDIFSVYAPLRGKKMVFWVFESLSGALRYNFSVYAPGFILEKNLLLGLRLILARIYSEKYISL